MGIRCAVYHKVPSGMTTPWLMSQCETTFISSLEHTAIAGGKPVSPHCGGEAGQRGSGGGGAA